MSDKRILWVDNLKGFLILLVVLGHIIQYSCLNYNNLHVFKYIYSFHMPLFFVVSGFLSYKPLAHFSGKKVLMRRGRQLLIPYILWGGLCCFLTEVSLVRGLLIMPIYWFLILLFFITVLMFFCQAVASDFCINLGLVCTFMIIVLFAIYILFKPRVLSLNILHIHFLFYSLGWYLRKYQSKVLRDWMIIPSGLLILFLGWFYKCNESLFILSSLPLSFYFLMSGFFGSLFFISFFRRIVNIKIDVLSHIGRLTLGVYVCHILICRITEKWMHRWVEYVGMLVGVMSLFIAIVFITLCIVFLLEKNKKTRFLIGLSIF